MLVLAVDVDGMRSSLSAGTEVQQSLHPHVPQRYIVLRQIRLRDATEGACDGGKHFLMSGLVL